MVVLFTIRSSTYGVAVQRAASAEISRRRHRGLYSSPEPFCATTPGTCSVGLTGPRFTVQLGWLQNIRPQVEMGDHSLLERPCLDAPSTVPRSNDKTRRRFGAVVRDVRPVPGHAVRRAVEDRRMERVGRVFIPRPVRQVAGVAALITQGLLVCPGKVAVPC
jgi:hypothetical protein